MKFKLSLVFACLSLSLGSLALAVQSKPSFDEMKSKMSTEIDQRIQKLQEHKACVTAATNGDALKACHQSMKEWRESEHAQHKKMREERRAQHKEASGAST